MCLDTILTNLEVIIMWDYKEGDIVYFNHHSRYRGAIGVVKGISCIGSDYIDFYVLIEGDKDKKENYHIAEDDEIEYVYHVEMDNDLLDKPAFQIGDIVNTTNGIQIVREVVISDIGEMAEYMYEVSPIDSDDINCCYKENSLEFLYHDVMWEEYFTESAQNGLPEWKDETYDMKELDDYYLSTYDYYNYTLPPVIMKYIIDEYTIYGRIDAVLAHKSNVTEIEKIFDLKSGKLSDIRRSIIDKIHKRNESDIDPEFKKKINNRRKFQFTNLELSVVSEISKRDISFGKIRYHFPVYMTNMEIIKSVKEAYNSAHKVGKREIKKSCVIRCMIYNKFDPVKGRVLYEGYSSTYNLVIQFYYNFDLDIIETAYPIGVNKSEIKKH